MAYPVYPVVKPMSLVGVPNGMLTLQNLASTPFAGVGYGSLHPLAKRAWQAMTVACLAKTKVQLTVTSVADAYRTYALQEQVFRQRYRQTYNPLICTRSESRVWNGTRWWKLKNVAPVATPGTSNHGWALAVDVAIHNGSSHPAGITTNPTVFDWLQKNAVSFGFSWESQVEAWHIRYFAGDMVPQRVIDIETFLAELKP